MTMTTSDEELSAGLYIQKQMLPEWRIKKTKLIDNIVKLLRPKAQERDASREDIARVTLRVACANALMRAKDQGSTKPGKRAAGQLASTLRRIDAVLNNPALDSVLRATVRAQTPADKSKELARSAENFMTGSLRKTYAEDRGGKALRDRASTLADDQVLPEQGRERRTRQPALQDFGGAVRQARQRSQ
jgi:hypothetical protein